MRILAIETSCDETGAAVVEKKDGEKFVRVLSNVTATSLAVHARTGGIIPENAAREQVKYIIPVVVEALLKSGGKFNNLTIQQFNNLDRNQNSISIDPKQLRQASTILKNTIDAIAVTHGPGLIGSLLVGVETAKTLSFAFGKPIIPVHHLLAHLFANFIHNTPASPSEAGRAKYLILNTKNAFPFVGLIVSGGHTDLVLFESISKFKWLGGTRDDASGEALDKIGRLLGFAYPAGPEIERRANLFRTLKANPQLPTAKFHSPMINSDDFDFSFSGLKSEAARFIASKNLTEEFQPKVDPPLAEINQICYALQDAIISVLVKKTIRATNMYNISQILLGGGVSANQTLVDELKLQATRHLPHAKIFAPEKQYSIDNAAMIGAFALLNYKPISWQKITAQPELYFD